MAMLLAGKNFILVDLILKNMIEVFEGKSSTHDFVNLPVSFQDLYVVAGKKLAKEYGLEDNFSKSAVYNEGTSTATIEDDGSKVPDDRDKGDNEDVMDDTA